MVSEALPCALYCLKADTLSVYPRPDGRKESLYVPAGAVISVGERNSEMGPFVEVHWNEKTVLMFPQDIVERAEALPRPAYAGAGHERAAAAPGFGR
jgi:hypothetical protein